MGNTKAPAKTAGNSHLVVQDERVSNPSQLEHREAISQPIAITCGFKTMVTSADGRMAKLFRLYVFDFVEADKGLVPWIVPSLDAMGGACEERELV